MYMYMYMYHKQEISSFTADQEGARLEYPSTTQRCNIGF